MNEDAQSGADEAEESALEHIPTILWQRRWLLVVPTVLGALAGVSAAFLLPTAWRSTAIILVESQQLPAEMVGSPLTSVIDKRIAKIRQVILSRETLIELIQVNNLYPSERQSTSLSELIERIRQNTTIVPVVADIDREAKSSNTIAFSMSFEYPNAALAQAVAQDLVDRLVRLDATQTAEQAASTAAFLQEQSNGLTTQIDSIEKQIASIKAANGTALSSAGMMMMPSGGGGYEAQIAALQRENAQLTSQISAAATAAARDPVVASAEAQLAGLRSVYSDNHPDVRMAQQRLVEAKALAARTAELNPAAAMLRQQIASNNLAIASLNAARGAEASRASGAMAAASRAPAVAEQVAQLQAKADELRTRAATVASNLMNAQASLKMSSQQKGERLTIVDPPVVPDTPSSPNRPLLIGGGLAAGLFLGIAIAFLLELILQPIRGVDAVRRALGAPPLVAVPTLHVPGKKRRWKFFSWPFRRTAA